MECPQGTCNGLKDVERRIGKMMTRKAVFAAIASVVVPVMLALSLAWGAKVSQINANTTNFAVIIERLDNLKESMKELKQEVKDYRSYNCDE